MPLEKRYEITEHTADIGIRAFGADVQELFINAARGMFDIIADTHRIKPKEKAEIQEEATAADELLVAWLRELLYQYNTTGIIFNEFVIQSLSTTQIKAIAWGDRVPRDKIKAEIKAVTYHALELKQAPQGYEAKVIFDV